MDRGVWWATVHGVAELYTTGRLTLDDVTLPFVNFQPAYTTAYEVQVF